MNIVTAFEALAVEGMEGGHDRVIETVLSKLFVRGDKVHKAYKHRVADFADLTDREVRREYIAEDFFWNNAMAPEVYLELRGVKRVGDEFVHVPLGEDWYIVMQKIDTEKDLMRAIMHGTLCKEDLVEYVRVLMERLTSLSAARRPPLEAFFERGAAHVHAEVLGTCDWAYTADEFLSRADVDRAGSLMRRALESEQYFTGQMDSIAVVIDTNAENILFLDGGVSFIDVMPPKDAWRVHDRYFAICRTSADIGALSDCELAEALHESYALVPPPEAVRVVYEIAAALIQVPYRKMVGREDLSVKYANFVRLRSNDLALLLDEAGV